MYKGYRWFPEYIDPDKIEGYESVSDAPLDLQIEWQQKYLDSMQKFYPSDLRERKIKFWIDGISSRSRGSFGLYCLSGDAHVAVNEENQSASVVYHTIYQIGISGNK